MIPRLLSDNVHAVLLRYFGRAKADRLYIFYYRFSGLIFSALILIAGGVAFIALYEPTHYKAQNKLLVPVQFIYQHASDTGQARVYATFELPDGNSRTVSTQSLAIAASTLESICVFRLSSVDGKERYRWVPLSDCDHTSY
ncbi:hypothetical protein BXY66_1340 [Shimia isoporae]|uniref:Uncharacterized protein n=1 Tax=Shimia isoporae TaxID=647720 RepID=A0A4R1NMC2_9RHOB|nr:hypothetical protein [Shimia isoporae]TCL09295.1 hypothetical protein BXY66_1340 [Shimia isoporae]